MIKSPPEFSKKSWRPPWIFSAASHLYLWSEKSPPENTKAMESAPLNLWRHFLSPPENEKAILMPPWILRRKTERRIHSKTAIFNRSIQGGLAHQKCYARVQPGYSVAGHCHCFPIANTYCFLALRGNSKTSQSLNLRILYVFPDKSFLQLFVCPRNAVLSTYLLFSSQVWQ